MTFSTDLADLFRRDLTTLVRQLEAFPKDELLWQTVPGVANAAGNLVLHLEGNLREYVGRQLGGVPYTRNRPLEFSARDVAKHELARRIREVAELIPAVVGALTPVQLQAEYPQVVLERPLSTHAFLTHLYGHFNWHLGQIDYLRRVLSGEGAVGRAGI